MSIVTKHNNFNDETLKIIFIQGLFNKIWSLMTLKLIKLMIEAYSINKFYIWIWNQAVNVEYISSFSSTPGYQSSQGSKNIYFFTSHYSSTVFIIISEIKFITSPALFTAVIPTAICNYIPTISNSYFQSSLNKVERNHYHDNNLCFYCRELNH